MKAIFDLWRHRYLRTVGSLLISIALIAGVVSCTTPVAEYDLTMAVNPAGGGTATDVTGTSPYAEAKVVNITATAAPCYRFVNWTAPAGTFGDPNAATTTFTMPARDVTVTANFELTPPDHFKFYSVYWETAPYIGKNVTLVDQFGTFEVKVGDAISFGNPVEKQHNDAISPIEDPLRHYTIYMLDYGEGPTMFDSWQVVVSNQFQADVELTVRGPIALAVPTQKEDLEAPVCLNHYALYEVIEAPFEPVTVELEDQFMDETVTVNGPVLFGNPVQKTVGSEVTDIEKEDEHWVMYWIEGEPIDPRTVQIDNQFGPQALDLDDQDVLAVPSQKLSVEQPLDHFKAYWAEGMEIGAEVQVEDQFITEWLGGPLTVTVGYPFLFANPVNKGHGESWTPISDWDRHLTLYSISYPEGFRTFLVTVSNQFDAGAAPQQYVVLGPQWLAVPTQKGDQDLPEDLDHFLVYLVVWTEVGPAQAEVYLRDQFTEGSTPIFEPYLFANPTQKIHDAVVTPMKHPEEHLMWYRILGGAFAQPGLPINNQFDPQYLTVYQEEYDVLGVPSIKLDWSLVPL